MTFCFCICDVLPQEMSFDTFPPIWSHVTENKIQDRKKIKTKKKLEKKIVWRCAGKAPLKIALILIRLMVSEKIVLQTDERRTPSP